jgi:peptidoglycan/LPS O-acetylase OafA/YrhL
MRDKLAALTSLRFFAAAAIFALHAEQFPGFPKGNFFGFTLNHGVSFFYVLSGFILQYNYRDRADKTNRLNFIALRFFRLWPLHLIALAMAATLAWSNIVSWCHAYVSTPSLLGIIFLLQAWHPDHHVFFSINGVSWSLSVELFFYSCFLPMSTMARRSPGTLLLLVSVVSAMFLYVAWSLPYFHQFAAGMYIVNPVARLPEFALGVLGAEYRAQHEMEAKNLVKWTLAESAFLFLLLAFNWGTPWVEDLSASLLGRPVGLYLHTAFSAPACAALIYVFSRQGGLVSSWLSWRPLMLLGEASFAIYLIHQPVQGWMSARLTFLSPWALTVLCVLVVVTLSMAAHRYVEMPAYRWARSRFSGARGHNPSSMSRIKIQ